VIDCNEWRTEKRHECANVGKVKRLEVWWQLYRTSLPVWDFRKFQADGFLLTRVCKRSTSAFVWCCQWMVSSFLGCISSVRSSSWRQLTTPKLHQCSGTANDPRACFIFFALNSVPKTNLSLFKYSFFNFSFSFLCSVSWLSSIPSYLFAFVGSGSVSSFSNVLLTYIFCWNLPFLKKTYSCTLF